LTGQLFDEEITMTTLSRWTALILLPLSLLIGCSTQVSRVDIGEQIDLSGAWNDTDSQMVAHELVNVMLAGRWLRDYRIDHDNKPAIIVGDVTNLSHEHINTQTFISDMQRELINAGPVRFVASASERDTIRSERRDQDIHASDATRKAMGEELGADFMLVGSVNTIIDALDRDQVRYYQVDLNLISLRDNSKVWIGQKKIKKMVARSKLRF
jgi:penicillin-binding protein activator